MRKILLNLHLYAALTAAAFIALLGLTGTIMAFETELDHELHPKRSYVAPLAHPPMSLAEIAAATPSSDAEVSCGSGSDTATSSDRRFGPR